MRVRVGRSENEGEGEEERSESDANISVCTSNPGSNVCVYSQNARGRYYLGAFYKSARDPRNICKPAHAANDAKPSHLNMNRRTDMHTDTYIYMHNSTHLHAHKHLPMPVYNVHLTAHTHTHAHHD